MNPPPLHHGPIATGQDSIPPRRPGVQSEYGRQARSAAHLVTVSLPTGLAIARASTVGLSLWRLARDDNVPRVGDAAV